jgi:HEAT repeat protein
MTALYFLDAIVLVLGLVLLIVAAVVEEVAGPINGWIAKRRGLADPGQSPAVQCWAIRLSFRNRAKRLEAAERLGDLNDRSAVPALIRAASRYNDDGPFLEVVVRSLAALGDERALPTLRRLCSGRHHSLCRLRVTPLLPWSQG